MLNRTPMVCPDPVGTQIIEFASVPHRFVVEYHRVAFQLMIDDDLPDEVLEQFRAEYPLILTTAHVAEMMHSTIGDVRDKVHRGELRAYRWGQQFRFLREEVLSVLKPYIPGEPAPEDEDTSDATEWD